MIFLVVVFFYFFVFNVWIGLFELFGVCFGVMWIFFILKYVFRICLFVNNVGDSLDVVVCWW